MQGGREEGAGALQVVEEEEGAESEKDGVVEADVEERAASRGVHDSHGRVGGEGDGGFGEGICLFVKEGAGLFTFLRWDSCTG